MDNIIDIIRLIALFPPSQGDYRKAEVFYGKAQSLDPQNTIVLGNLKKLQSLQAKKN